MMVYPPRETAKMWFLACIHAADTERATSRRARPRLGTWATVLRPPRRPHRLQRRRLLGAPPSARTSPAEWIQVEARAWEWF